MNHRAIVEHEAMRLYRHRAYVLAKLDQRHFDALNAGHEQNPGGHLIGLNGYCLDALSDIPSGCMCVCADRPAEGFTARGRTLVEQRRAKELVARLVAEILAEHEARERGDDGTGGGNG